MANKAVDTRSNPRRARSSANDTRPSLVWFRHDLRLDDNAALIEACRAEGPVVPVFIWAPKDEGAWPPGAASRFWLDGSLRALAKQLQEKGSRLIVRQGESLAELRKLLEETGARTVFWNRRHEPSAQVCEHIVSRMLHDKGIDGRVFKGNLLREPTEVETLQGSPYQVFTAYWKRFLDQRQLMMLPEPAPDSLPSPQQWPLSLEMDDLGLKPEIGWAAGIRQAWTPGAVGARQAFEAFSEVGLEPYPTERDFPAADAVSRLSPHLHFGEISVRRLWHSLVPLAKDPRDTSDPAAAFLRQLVWREFAHHLLHHFPHTTDRPLKGEFRNFDWASDQDALKAWQRGRTGYPIVDAGMGQLWTTGWMHNRVRMIAASFLVKDLRQDWLHGARWFWDTLVDADLANNTLGWQWVAGCGADAAPYFRIFNPVLQGQKFDPEGSYIQRWLPELSRLPAPHIHQPWKAPGRVLDKAGVRLGRDYPEPIVDHAAARQEALESFHRMKERASLS